MLQDLLNRIDALKAELDDLRPLKPEDEHRLWQKLRLEWNYNSNHIEGNTLTYGETHLLLIHGKTNGGHTMREFEEMKAHDLAISMVREWAEQGERDLTEADIRDLNRILLKEPFWKEAITADGQATTTQILPGEYKRQPNNVRLPNGEIFHFASVEETPSRMSDLMEWLHGAHAMHPVQRAAKFHHEFVVIHPFGDGNGRTARLVVNYILMRAGYMPLVIKSADKASYLNALHHADAGDEYPLVEYLGEQEAIALRWGLNAARGESVEEEEDWRKKGELLKRQLEEGRRRTASDRGAFLERRRLAIELLFDGMASALDDVARAHSPFFDTATAHISIYGLGGVQTSFGQLPPGLAFFRADLLRYLGEDKYKDYVQFSYDLNGFKHGAELRRWYMVNWFFELDGMRLEFVPKELEPIVIAYGASWKEVERSFISGLAEWIQDGIRKKSQG